MNTNRTATGLGLAVLLGLVACQPLDAQQANASETPSEHALQAAFHPGYHPASDTLSECLGRLVFEVPAKAPFEWGIRPLRQRDNQVDLGFGPVLRAPQELLMLGNTSVVVFEKADANNLADLLERVDISKSLASHRYDDRIRSTQGYLKRLIEALNTNPEVKDDPSKSAEYRTDIANLQKEIEGYKADKQALNEDWHPTDWGLPDSLGYMGPHAVRLLAARRPRLSIHGHRRRGRTRV